MMDGISSDSLREHIRRVVEKQLEQTDTVAPELGDLIRRYLSRPAKLIRPRLLTEAARVYGGGDTTAVLDLAAGTELLHVFALIHDDRIDGIDRDNRPIKSTGHEAALRVLAGDLLHTIADGVIAEAVARHHLSPRILETVRRISAVSVAGQVRNMHFIEQADTPPSRTRLFELYDLKTGYYSFAAPLQIGALAAAPEGTESEALEHMGLLLGRAFQLRDDAVDILELSSADFEAVPAWELNLLATFLYETAPESKASWSGTLPGAPGAAFNADPRTRRQLIEAVDFAELHSWVNQRIEELLSEVEAKAHTLSLSPSLAEELAGFARSGVT